MINKDTKLCISIAEYPSNVGTTLFNSAFKALKINYIYKSCQVDPGKLKAAINGIRALNIRGCGVTMPFKKEATKYCDYIDKLAQDIGVINTIINTDGRLKGFNTDYYGVMKSLENLSIKGKEVTIAGAGGIARAIICALKKLKVKQITVCNRTFKKAVELASAYSCEVAKWDKRHMLKADIFINATSIGMKPNVNGLPIDENSIKNYQIIVDLVNNPIETLLIKKAKEINRIVIPGYQISLYQAAKQFELYTGLKPPIDIMRKALFKLIQS